MKNKRGIEPIISVVLMIAFAIVLFLLVSNWIQKSIVKSSMEKTDEKLTGQLDCMSTIISVSDICVKPSIAAPITIAMNVDNSGDTNIDGLTIRVLNAAGAVGTVPFTAGSPVPSLGRVISKSTDSTITGSVPNVNKVEIYPSTNGKVCKDQIYTTTNIKAC